MAHKLGWLLIAKLLIACQLITTESTDFSVNTFVSFKNQENSKVQFENLEECELDCQYYEKCEAFLYYDDFRCFLFYLNKNLSSLNEKIDANKNRNYIYGFKSKVFTTKLENVELGKLYSHRLNEITLEQCFQNIF